MNKLKFKYAIGLIAAAFIMVANLQYAFSEYGIPFASTLHINVLAQTSNGSGNSSTGGGTSSGGTSSGGDTSSSNGNNTGNEDAKCPDFNYVPNRTIHAEKSDSKIHSNANGELVINGVLKVGFRKNTDYPVIIETKNCSKPASGACCDQRQVGVKIVSY